MPHTEPASPALGWTTRFRRGSGRTHPAVLAAVSVGGMAGASARYGIATWMPTTDGRFPWGTWWANMAGSFLLGLALVLILERFPPTRLLRPFLATGVMGALTTMSTFQVETALLVDDGYLRTAVVYSVGSIVAGLILAYTGILTGRLIASRPMEHRS